MQATPLTISSSIIADLVSQPDRPLIGVAYFILLIAAIEINLSILLLISGILLLLSLILLGK